MGDRLEAGGDRLDRDVAGQHHRVASRSSADADRRDDRIEGEAGVESTEREGRLLLVEDDHGGDAVEVQGAEFVEGDRDRFGTWFRQGAASSGERSQQVFDLPRRLRRRDHHHLDSIHACPDSRGETPEAPTEVGASSSPQSGSAA